MQTRTLYSDSLLTIQPRTHTTTLIRHTVDTQTHITTWCYPRGDIPYTPNSGHGLNSVFAWCSSWCTYLEIVVGPRLGECPRFDGVLTHLGPRLEAFTDPQTHATHTGTHTDYQSNPYSLTKIDNVTKSTGSRFLSSEPRFKWSPHKLNGLLTRMQHKREPVTRIWRFHFVNEYDVPYLTKGLREPIELIGER